MTRLFPLLLLALGACMAVNGVADTVPLDTDLQWDTGSLEDTGDGLDSENDVVYWGLEGTMVVAEGSVQTQGSSMVLSFWTQDLDQVCMAQVQVLGITNTTPPRDVDLITWWHVELGTPVSCEPAWSRYQQLNLGLGVLDPRLEPAMEAHDLAPEATGLYGLYVQELVEHGPVEPIYVFGVGGSQANYAGTEDPVEAAPLPEGSYTLQGLYLLPWTSPPGG